MKQQMTKDAYQELLMNLLRINGRSEYFPLASKEDHGGQDKYILHFRRAINLAKANGLIEWVCSVGMTVFVSQWRVTDKGMSVMQSMNKRGLK